MNSWTAAGAAATFTWFGMVAAISFLEAPLKFRAPGVTLPVGLQIGRLVFRALNGVEVLLAAVALTAVLAGPARTGAVTATVVAVAMLAGQLAVVRPFLHRRTARVLAGETGARSRAHLGYVAAEVVKVVALLAAGFQLLS